jgi:hypothetical protein
MARKSTIRIGFLDHLNFSQISHRASDEASSTQSTRRLRRPTLGSVIEFRERRTTVLTSDSNDTTQWQKEQAAIVIFLFILM